MSFNEITIDEAIAKITGAKALILCHRNPDADTVCSALALSEIIRMTGGKARPVCSDYIPARIRFMATDIQMRLARDEEIGKKVFAVDVAAPAQLGNIAHLKDRCEMIIDHHASCERFADYLADPSASSAGEIVARIYEKMKAAGTIEESPRVCRYLYAAIASDTGSFKFSNTTGETLRTAAKLIDVINATAAPGKLPLDKMDTSDIARLMFDTKSFAEIRGDALAVKNMILRANDRLALTIITKADLAAEGITENDIGGAVDEVRSAAGVLVGVSLKETNPGEYRISARSNCSFDVSAVCEKFGGGGHVRAAGGGVSAATPEEALRVVGDAFAEALEASLEQRRREREAQRASSAGGEGQRPRVNAES